MILNLDIKNVIAECDDGKPAELDLKKLNMIAVHRCGKDLKYDIDLGDTAVEVCAHFTGKDDQYPEVAKATGGEVGYHFMIGGDLGDHECDGVIWQCLQLSDVGRHAKQWNSVAIGVGVIADPRVRPCSSRQMHSLTALLSLLSMNLKLEPSECVRGHMELPGASSNPNKLCPGPMLPMNVLRGDVLQMRADLALQLSLASGIVL